MKLLNLFILFAALTAGAHAQDLCPPQLSMPSYGQHYLSLSLGSRGLDTERIGASNLFDNNWYDRGGQDTYGLAYHYGSPGAIGWEAGVLFGSGDTTNNIHLGTGTVDGTKTTPGVTESETTELFLGLRYEADTGSIRPYVGAGVCYIDAKEYFAWSDPPSSPGAPLGSGSASGTGTTAGFYLHAGVNLMLDDSVSIGLDYRSVLGTENIDFFPGLVDDGGTSMDSSVVSLVLGFGF